MKKFLGIIMIVILGFVSFGNAFDAPAGVDKAVDNVVIKLVSQIEDRGVVFRNQILKALKSIETQYVDNELYSYIIIQIIEGIQEKVFKETFIVTVENISYSSSFASPFAPIVYSVYDKDKTKWLFTEGEIASLGIESIAEDGKTEILREWVQNYSNSKDSGVEDTPNGGTVHNEIFDGDTYSFEFDAGYSDTFNFVTMIAQTNDLFIASYDRGLDLFNEDGNPLEGDISKDFFIWDAGTEINEAPGIGPTQAPRQGGINIGPDENGVVHTLDDGYEYPRADEMLRITIEVK